jgi:hypothetical protein
VVQMVTERFAIFEKCLLSGTIGYGFGCNET